MITVEVSGGLGNQMYKFAFGFAMAKKFHQPLSIDTSISDYVDFRDFGLDELSVSYEKRISYRRGKSLWHRCFRHLREKKALGDVIAVCQGKDPYYYSECFEQQIGSEGDFYLYGGWANYRYFDGIREEIQRIFLPKETDAEVESLAEKFQLEDSVAIHVRRGDYLNLGITLLPDYYQQAIQKMMDEQAKKNLQFYVFSDDIEYCKQLFAPFGTESFHFPQYQNEHKTVYDMYLMSRCKNLIIANSTYSWWSAYLAKEGAYVIAPVLNIWSEDLYPEEWQTICL